MTCFIFSRRPDLFSCFRRDCSKFIAKFWHFPFLYSSTSRYSKFSIITNCCWSIITNCSWSIQQNIYLLLLTLIRKSNYLEEASLNAEYNYILPRLFSCRYYFTPKYSIRYATAGISPYHLHLEINSFPTSFPSYSELSHEFFFFYSSREFEVLCCWENSTWFLNFKKLCLIRRWSWRNLSSTASNLLLNSFNDCSLSFHFWIKFDVEE